MLGHKRTGPGRPYTWGNTPRQRRIRMDDNAIHEWLIKCFGPIQGEMAWQQISQLPEEIREQLMSQDPSRASSWFAYEYQFEYG
mgnify:CR=1 FL=1